MTIEPLPSFEEIASQLSPSLRGYLIKMVGNAADADELLQETLMRIARGLTKFEGRSSPKTWAFRIATNVAIDFLRSSKSDKLVEFTDLDTPSDTDEEEELIVDQINSCVRQVIDSLPPDYRAPLVLQCLEGKEISEIAEVCDMSIANTKVRLHRAKARLKEALNKDCSFYRSAAGNLRCDRKQPDES